VSVFHPVYIKSDRSTGSDLQAYADGLVDAGIARVPPDSEVQQRPRYQGLPSEHLCLLESGRTVIKQIAKDARVLNAAAPTLLHHDLHKRNIFVSENDPTVITGIIDWQSTSIEPAFWYSDDVPDFARYTPDPSGRSDPDSELCAKAFDHCVRLLMPKLAVPKSLDESIFRPFRYCYRTWKDSAAVFHHELIETSRHWTDLGFAGLCPFTIPGSEVLTTHREHYKRFLAANSSSQKLSVHLNTGPGGWVPLEDWEAALLAHEEAFANVLEAILTYDDPDNDEPIKTERDLREIWPYDRYREF